MSSRHERASKSVQSAAKRGLARDTYGELSRLFEAEGYAADGAGDLDEGDRLLDISGELDALSRGERGKGP